MRFKQPPKVEIKIVDRPVNKLTLAEWKSQDRLVSGAASALNGDFMKLMIQVLENESPAGVVFSPFADVQTRACHQAKIEGYQLALTNLQSMGTVEKSTETLVSTFEEPERE